MDIRTIIKIDQLIKNKATGNPDELARKLNLSVRMVFNYIKFMREQLNAPIEFSKYANSYTYNKSGEFNFKWMEN